MIGKFNCLLGQIWTKRIRKMVFPQLITILLFAPVALSFSDFWTAEIKIYIVSIVFNLFNYFYLFALKVENSSTIKPSDGRIIDECDAIQASFSDQLSPNAIYPVKNCRMMFLFTSFQKNIYRRVLFRWSLIWHVHRHCFRHLQTWHYPVGACLTHRPRFKPNSLWLNVAIVHLFRRRAMLSWLNMRASSLSIQTAPQLIWVANQVSFVNIIASFYYQHFDHLLFCRWSKNSSFIHQQRLWKFVAQHLSLR